MGERAAPVAARAPASAAPLPRCVSIRRHRLRWALAGLMGSSGAPGTAEGVSGPGSPFPALSPRCPLAPASCRCPCLQTRGPGSHRAPRR